MKSFLLSILVACPIFLLGQQKKQFVLNPTGSYKLNSKSKTKGGETYGYWGDLKIKSINDTCIVLTLYVNKGAPSYNSGAIWDTLLFKKNIAVFVPISDSTCKITFLFSNKGITVAQKQSDLNFGCGFGHGVFADGFYRKISSKVPVIKDQGEE